MAQRIGNAPVSFGAWSLEAARNPSVPPPERVLAEIAAAGYDGIELGPLGWLDPAAVAAHRLELTGGYVGIPFGAGLGDLDATLDVFDAFAPAARPIVADDGDMNTPLDHADVARVVDRIRERGYEPAFHHHMGTRVETRAQIEQLLAAVDVPLLLDTGHLLAAGVQPTRALHDWRDRIDYVHVKDLDVAALRAAPDWPTAWRRNVFCELGTGDVDVHGFLAALDGFDGWVVVEQDWVPQPGDDAESQIVAQARNLARVRARSIAQVVPKAPDLTSRSGSANVATLWSQRGWRKSGERDRAGPRRCGSASSASAPSRRRCTCPCSRSIPSGSGR